MGTAGSRPLVAATATPVSAPVRAAAGQELATFAAGCFWSVELAFQRMPGVLKTEVGYVGGSSDKHDYESVCRGTTGHAEAVQCVFDPAEISYNELLDVFWKKHDPTHVDRQGNDVGTQYRSAIFTHTPEQLAQAIASRDALAARLSNKVATEIRPIPLLGTVGGWWRAEAYHQQYLEKGGQCAAKGDGTPIRCYG